MGSEHIFVNDLTLLAILNTFLLRYGCLKYFFRNFFLCQQYKLFLHWYLFFYFISNNNCRLLTINIVSFTIVSTLTFVIYRHPVTLFTRDADWHKLVTDLFYDFVSILLVWVAKFKMPSTILLAHEMMNKWTPTSF
jgi:hypothetical protein